MRVKIIEEDGSVIFLNVESKQDVINLNYLSGKTFSVVEKSEDKPADTIKRFRPSRDEHSIQKLVVTFWNNGVKDRNKLAASISSLKGYEVTVATVNRSLSRAGLV
ncbi:hypothetical protein SEA_PHREDRICK_241 [Streptomyces phage Phredrick]|uniref:Uncharacterized protein n=1 Tax=Streptomyces phage Gilson TaxID=2488789 RepID=A0A3T0ID22_9CAUD|nr:hypothetical protein HWB98_gp048 [Streptomyces phage Gilson]AZU97281.1 hypothetical protein SEA_GILSON_236 [Streptomyces phage Gilson]WNN94794.1 hypothetical protein SEA_PHREDRICK_241 [Streptomyces phage Phredrick]